MGRSPEKPQGSASQCALSGCRCQRGPRTSAASAPLRPERSSNAAFAPAEGYSCIRRSTLLAYQESSGLYISLVKAALGGPLRINPQFPTPTDSIRKQGNTAVSMAGAHRVSCMYQQKSSNVACRWSSVKKMIADLDCARQVAIR